MSPITTNYAAFMAHNALSNHNQQMFQSLKNLSTGLRLQSAKDDPGGMVASNALQSDMVGIDAAINSITRGEQIIATAEGAIVQINELLLELQAIVTESGSQGGIGESERASRQGEVDLILEAIDRIATGTEFNGSKLLDGNLDYQLSGEGLGSFDWVHINNARLGTNGQGLDVHSDVLVQAQRGQVGITLNNGVLDSSMGLSVTFEITGPGGVQQFTFADGTNKLDMEASISTFAEELGIQVDLSSNDELIIQTGEYGSAQSVKVNAIESNGQDSNGNTFIKSWNGNSWEFDVDNVHTDKGVDAQMLINGQVASVKGLEGRVVANGFDVEVRLTEASNVVGSANFKIVSGGAYFDISTGPNRAGLSSLGIRSLTTGSIGGFDGVLDELRTGGSAAVVNGDILKAQRIIDHSVEEISSLQGRLGSFMRYSLESARNNLSATLEQVAAADSSIRDADLAWETASLARTQMLSQSAMQALSLANSHPMQVLTLLNS